MEVVMINNILNQWTFEEEKKLYLESVGKTAKELAPIFGRSPKACYSRLWKLKRDPVFLSLLKKVEAIESIKRQKELERKKDILKTISAVKPLFPQQNLRNDRNVPSSPY